MDVPWPPSGALSVEARAPEQIARTLTGPPPAELVGAFPSARPVAGRPAHLLPSAAPWPSRAGTKVRAS
jgi:hypothetical protein